MDVRIRKLRDDAIQPTYGTTGAACFDLYVPAYAGEYWLQPGDSATVSTGMAFEVPEGHVMLVFSRSGHGFNFDTRLANCVGVIDSDYRGEVMVKLTRDREYGEELCVRGGDRIAQAMVVPFPRVTFLEVGGLSMTERGTGGFGSTGA